MSRALSRAVIAARRLALSDGGPRPTPRPARGFTLIEVLVASVLATVVAGGTMMAYITAARIARGPSSQSYAEAFGYAQQTAERFRNLVADDAAYTAWLAASAGPAWHTDVLPASGGTESVIALGARRCYRVTPLDCDGVGGAGDCHNVEVKVCWNDLTGCPCP